jgi:hypothetical protein
MDMFLLLMKMEMNAAAMVAGMKTIPRPRYL